jgi:ribosomal protein L15E
MRFAKKRTGNGMRSGTRDCVRHGVLVELLKGHPTYAAKARAISKEEQFVPIVVVEEIQRGRLNRIRQAAGSRLAVPGYHQGNDATPTKSKLSPLPPESARMGPRLSLAPASAAIIW